MSQTKADAALPEGSESLDRKTLFVRSIPAAATSDELSEYFSQFVPVKHAVVVTDEEKKSRGFGFVSFTMEEDTLTALVEAKKNKFQNNFLRVDIAKRRDRKGKKEEGVQEVKKVVAEPVEKRKARLIIRNLPWSCKEPDTLRKLFLKFGAVHDAYIPTKKGGLMKGFAFVTMKKNAAAERAVKESVGLKIDGREVAVDLAVEKSKWEKIQEEEAKEVKSQARERPAKEEEAEEENVEEMEEDEVEEEEEKDNEDSDADSDSDTDSESESDEFDKLNEIEEEKPKTKLNKQEAFSVFVRNIPYDADNDSLKEHFSSFGPVKYALSVVDKVTGVAKGSAFVAFKTHEGYTDCLANAPSVSSTSMLISDDVAPEYVYQGRILSIVSTIDRDSANKLAERNSAKRKEEFGIDVGEKDKRNLFLLNEGRITENSKLAQFISTADMEIREKSYKLRVQQLNKNPTLHLSLTRLAIRNLPRAMTAKALKALGRKAVVQFATEVKDEKRQPLSKEEVSRSVKFKHDNEGPKGEEEKKRKSKKAGVVKQAKVIMEVKGSGEAGRSRGYGFIEYRDHKAALMGLRWLNAHEVTAAEILEGLDELEKKLAASEGINKRKLIVEFAIENAQVVKRRREMEMIARHGKRKRDDDEGGEDETDKKKQKKKKGPSRKGNMNKGAKNKDGDKADAKPEQPEKPKSGLSDNVKNIIGRKRKMRKGKK